MAHRCIRHILCPIDFSVESDTALDCAEHLADKLGARVTVVHAERFEAPLEFTSAQVETIVAEMNELKKNAAHHLKEYARRRCPSLTASYEVVESTPVEGILRVAEDRGVDLILMGTTGKSGVRRIAMGSVAEGVTREAKVPVLTVRDKSWTAVNEPKVGRMLVPVNYTDGAAEALKTAACLAELIGASLLVTHIVESSDSDEEAARQRLCEWVPEVMQRKCEYDTAVLKGNAAEQIVRMAADKQVDMIVLANVHRPFLESTIIGTTSERVMRHAPCPVLTVPVGKE